MYPPTVFPLFSLSFWLWLSHASPLGLTGDECTLITHPCIPPRLCMQDIPPYTTPCDTSVTPCSCHPPSPVPCTKSSDCPFGEICAGNPSTCLSCLAEEEDPSVSLIDSRQNCPRPYAIPRSTSSLTGEPCFINEDCHPPRRCLKPAGDGPCDGRASCHCFQEIPVRCNLSADCPVGEACVANEEQQSVTVEEEMGICVAQAVATGLPGLTILVGFNPKADLLAQSPSPSETALPSLSPLPLLSPSPSPSPSPSQSQRAPVIAVQASSSAGIEVPTADVEAGEVEVDADGTHSSGSAEAEIEKEEGGVCIAMHHMEHFEESALVFSSSRMAHVLCDKGGNCATKGHFILVKGDAMMMGDYCSMVHCVRRMMAVNSPRMKRGLRVKGRTEGVEFSAMAVRWGTRAEKLAVKVALGLGF